jgi:hypothetical protein
VGRAEAPSQEAEVVTGIPHKARAADELVVLVSPRHAVWDRRSASLPKPTDEVHEVTACGELPTDWTADLVHCRLVHVVGLMRRLSRPKVPAGMRSFLGNLQPATESVICPRPLDAAETMRLDWTWERVSRWPLADRAILQGIMTGTPHRTVAVVLAQLAARGLIERALKKTQVPARYQTITATMAQEWALLREPIDQPTREVWLSAARKLK